MTFELPPEQLGPAAWYGPEMAKRTDWAMTLEREEAEEVAAATQAFAARNADIAAMTAADFPLPRLGPKLAARLVGRF